MKQANEVRFVLALILVFVVIGGFWFARKVNSEVILANESVEACVSASNSAITANVSDFGKIVVDGVTYDIFTAMSDCLARRGSFYFNVGDYPLEDVSMFCTQESIDYLTR